MTRANNNKGVTAIQAASFSTHAYTTTKHALSDVQHLIMRSTTSASLSKIHQEFGGNIQAGERLEKAVKLWKNNGCCASTMHGPITLP
jgi:hypothetical protein